MASMMLSSACSDKTSEADYLEEDVAYKTELNDYETSLSDSCDLVLADGWNKAGDHYQLVGNETEDYDGTKVEIGVIKNNKWLQIMTSEHPFINEDGVLIGALSHGSFQGSIYQIETNRNHYFSYIGNGCFIYVEDFGAVLYNSENKKFFVKTEDALNALDVRAVDHTGETDYGEEHVVAYDSNYANGHSTYQIFDINLNTMESKKIDFNSDMKLEDIIVGPYQDGLFYLSPKLNDNSGKKDSRSGFYDLNGNKVIDLSDFNLSILPNNQSMTYHEYFCFHEGKAKAVTLNDQGHYFEVIINKSGKVLETNQLET